MHRETLGVKVGLEIVSVFQQIFLVDCGSTFILLLRFVFHPNSTGLIGVSYSALMRDKRMDVASR